MTKVVHAATCARQVVPGENCTCGAHEELLARKRRNRMGIIDNLPREVRDMVNEYGWAVVHACIDSGVEKPRNIRHLVETILDEFSPTRCSYSAQGRSTRVAFEMTKSHAERQASTMPVRCSAATDEP